MLTQRVEDQSRDQAIRMPDGAARRAFILDRLWHATITPPLPAIADVRAAARTDAKLREMLIPLEHRARERHRQVIGEALGGNVAKGDAFGHRVDALLATMRGLNSLLAYGWERDEIEAAWRIARDDFIAAVTHAKRFKNA